MITIAADGVPQITDPAFASVRLSPMQHRLLTDPAPIRICGAPTGSGKTYAFIQDIRLRHDWVLFIVPTQALAANIRKAAQDETITAFVWDSGQHDRLIEEGRLVWAERINQVRQVSQQGGLIITTPETLGQIFLGVSYRHQRPEMDVALLLSAAHIVFDEVHLLTERALGFVHAWMTLIAGQRLLHYDKAKLTLLSATHSDLVTRLVGSEIPDDLVSRFDETVSAVPADSPSHELRVLHGPVTIRVDAETVPELIRDHLADLIGRHYRILVIFDSLRQYSQQAVAIERWAQEAGLTPNQVFVVTGQERQAGEALDAVHFAVGVHPSPHHRLIMGTSALEVGITYPDVTAAILDPGLTPAALIQRIGRVARGDVAGEILVATPIHTRPSHFLALQKLDGQVLSAEAFRQAFGAYVPIHWRRAQALGSAYWSMMRATRAPAYQALRELHGALSDTKVPGGLLNQLRHEAAGLPPNTKRRYQRWLDAVDRLLQDVRGFLPTVSLQFRQGQPFTYARDWALRYLRDPDDIDIETNRWIYHAPRDECLLDKPRPIQGRLLLPTHEGSMTIELPPRPQAYDMALERYVDRIRQSEEYSYHPIWDHTCRFIEATGLLIWDISPQDNTVDLPGIDGSLSL